MNYYEIISFLVAIVGITLVYFKKTHTYGYLCMALYFIIQAAQSLSSHNIKQAILLSIVALVVLSLTIRRIVISKATKDI
jgi:tellurite resistance protein TehA-like permease